MFAGGDIRQETLINNPVIFFGSQAFIVDPDNIAIFAKQALLHIDYFAHRGSLFFDLLNLGAVIRVNTIEP